MDSPFAADWNARLSEARDAAAQGMPVIGYVGGPFPLDLAEASGVRAIRLDGCPLRRTEAVDRWIDDKEDPRITALFAASLAGDFDFLSAIVVTRRYEYLHYFLREVLRLGEAPDLPPLHLLDLLPIDAPGIRTYDHGAFTRLAELLARIGTRADIPATDAPRRRRADALRALLAGQAAGTISGARSVALRLAGCSSAADEFASAVAAADDHQTAGRRLLLLSSEPFVDASLHEAIEARGWRIVRDDDGSGLLVGFEGDLGANSLAELTDLYAVNLPSQLADPREKRLGAVIAAAAEGDFDAALVLVDPTDNRLGWDYPAFRDACAAHNVPATLLRGRFDEPALAEKLDRALAELGEPALA